MTKQTRLTGKTAIALLQQLQDAAGQPVSVEWGTVGRITYGTRNWAAANQLLQLGLAVVVDKGTARQPATTAYGHTSRTTEQFSCWWSLSLAK